MSYISELNEILEDKFDEYDLDVDSNLLPTYALLLLTLGSDVTEEDVHDAWSIWKYYFDGDSEHDSLMPFSELDVETKKMDTPYAKAILDAFRTYKLRYRVGR